MRKLIPSLIALTMAGAFASLAQAQSTDVKAESRDAAVSQQPVDRAGASPAEQPQSTNSRADVKSEARAAARSSDRPMGQAGASPAEQPRSTNSRAEVKAEFGPTPRATDVYTEQTTMPHPSNW